MNKLKIFSCGLLFLLILLIGGCGTTNFLEWAKPKEKTDNIALARQYINEAKYDKAKPLLENENSKEGRILYAECLMGLSGLELDNIYKALTDHSVTNNPVDRLETLVSNPTDRDQVLEAANIFLANPPTETSDKLVGALCTMTAHTANLKQAFDTANIGFKNLNNRYTNAEIVSTNYASLGANPLRYITGAINLITSISDEPTIADAITTMNNAIVLINSVIGPSENLQIWSAVKPLMGL